jgi:hypothetical protein
MQEQAVRYFMDDHRVDGDAWLFVGSRWDSGAKARLGNVRLIEASSVALAADIAQLHYQSLSDQFITIIVEWACPIYVCA